MRFRSVVTLAVAGAVLLAGTSTPSYATTVTQGPAGLTPASSPAEQPAPYDGEAIFSGLLLGYGPVAEQFPELVAGGIGAERADSPDVAELVTEVTKAVEARDTSFFDGFQQAVTSGDRVRVDRALQSGQEMLGTVLTEDLGASVAVQDDASGTCIFVFVVVTVTVAVNLNVAANVNAAANVNVTYNVNVNSSNVTESTAAIDHERWVDEVAEALAA